MNANNDDGVTTISGVPSDDIFETVSEVTARAGWGPSIVLSNAENLPPPQPGDGRTFWYQWETAPPETSAKLKIVK